MNKDIIKIRIKHTKKGKVDRRTRPVKTGDVLVRKKDGKVDNRSRYSKQKLKKRNVKNTNK